LKSSLNEKVGWDLSPIVYTARLPVPFYKKYTATLVEVNYFWISSHRKFYL